MCGIAGVVDTGGAALDESALRAMAASMSARGPDDAGLHREPGLLLAHRRLAIIDLADGHQPMATADGALTVVFNGEIYNFRELRARLDEGQFRTRSDTEVILHAYRRWGTDAVAELDGMFALALWDRGRRRLLLARDRFGKKPLYYCLAGGALIFASTLSALLEHPLVPRQIDREALAEYLALESVVAPRTMLAGVRKLEPGHWLSFDATTGAVEQRRYWDLRVDGRLAIDEPEAEAELERLLAQAVRKRLISDVPLGVFLSGGVDSSMVTAFAAREVSGLRTFSVRFADPSFDESAHARQVAGHLGTRHLEEELTMAEAAAIVSQVGEILDEPIGDASIVPTYLLSRFVRRHVTVALGGDGGDELFAGYPTYVAHQIADLLGPARRVAPALRRLAARMPVSHANFSLDFKVKKLVAGLDAPLAERNPVWLGAFDRPGVARLLGEDHDVYAAVRARYAGGTGSHLERVLYQDVGLYMCHSVLAKVDRASMHASLEVRAPLLDTKVAEFAAALPLSLKLRRGQGKYLVKRLARRWLPREIPRRAKKGFGMPTGRWLKGELLPLLRDHVLGPGSLAAEGTLARDEVTRLVEQHAAGVADHRQRLWTLLVLELWRRARGIGAVTAP